MDLNCPPKPCVSAKCVHGREFLLPSWIFLPWGVQPNGKYASGLSVDCAECFRHTWEVVATVCCLNKGMLGRKMRWKEGKLKPDCQWTPALIKPAQSRLIIQHRPRWIVFPESPSNLRFFKVVVDRWSHKMKLKKSSQMWHQWTWMEKFDPWAKAKVVNKQWCCKLLSDEVLVSGLKRRNQVKWKGRAPAHQKVLVTDPSSLAVALATAMLRCNDEYLKMTNETRQLFHIVGVIREPC